MIVDNKVCGGRIYISTGMCFKCAFEKKTIEEGKRICSNMRTRACYSKIEQSDTHKRCANCREYGNSGEQRHRDAAEEENKQCKINTNTTGELPTKLCATCCKRFGMKEFVGNHGNEVKTCKKCREYGKIMDHQRANDPDRKAKKADAERKPEIKATRRRWRKNNYAKVTSYWIEYRKREISKDIVAYLKRNADTMAAYRATHVEEFKELYRKLKLDDEYRLTCYKRCAEIRGIQIEITDEFMKNLFNDPCFYCGREIDDKVKNGIDRMNNELDYIEENVVPCCEMCNMIKNCLDVNIFVKKCEHILTYNKLINGKIDYRLFSNKISHDIDEEYHTCINRAEEKGWEFSLSREEFGNIVNDKCYMCGKKTNEEHLNGIDRYNSKEGYILSNCRTCCKDCNYMKNKFTYKSYITKLQAIYENLTKNRPKFYKACEIPDEVETCNTEVIKKNMRPRMTKEERKQKHQEWLEEKRKKLTVRYCVDGEVLKEKLIREHDNMQKIEK